MKAFMPLFLVLLTAAAAQAAPLAKITTLTGKTYRQCEIVKVHPDGVTFTHANGAAKVLFTDLSSEWRERLGYDPAKARAYQEEQEALRQQQAEARRQQEKERGEALLQAQEMELARLRTQEIQARTAMDAAAAEPFPEESVVPVVTALGASVDSRDYRGVRHDRFGYPYSGFDGYWGGGYGFGYGLGWSPYPVYRPCPPFHHHHGHGFIGGGIRGRIGGVTFSIGR